MSLLGVAFVILAVSLHPLLPNLLDPRLPATSEVFRYMVLGEWFQRAWSLMTPYPRWLYEMNGGYGYPEFVFYQPAYFYVQALVGFFIQDWMGRQLVTLSLIAFVGGLGMYRLARLWLGRLDALWLVAVFSLAPYSRINLFSRGDLSEWMCLIGLPWSLWALVRFTRARGDLKGLSAAISWFLLAGVVALLCYSHPMAVIFLPGVLFFLAWSLMPGPWWSGISRRPLFEVMGAIVLGLLWSAPYWASVAIMKPLVLSEATYADWTRAHDNGAPFWTLLFGSFATPKTFHETEFLGAPFVVLALMGLWRGRNKALIRMTGGLYLLSLFLMTPSGRFFWQIHPFSLLQFPWRLALFAPVFQAVLAQGLLRGCPERWPRLAVMIGVVGILWLWNQHSPNQFRPWEELGPLSSKDYPCFLDFTRTARPGSYPATLDTGEWLPRAEGRALDLAPRQAPFTGADCDMLRHRAGDLVQTIFHIDPFPEVQPTPLVESEHPSWRVDLGVPSGHERPVVADLEGDVPTSIIIHQLYLEGWRVVLNGVEVPFDRLLTFRSTDGQIRFPLDPGHWHLEAWYEGPGHHRTMLGAILLGTFLAAAYWSLQRTRLNGSGDGS